MKNNSIQFAISKPLTRMVSQSLGLCFDMVNWVEHKMKAGSLNSKIRFEIFKRDKFTCQYCGKESPEVKLELDHIIPLSKKGKEETSNYLTACRECNVGKGNDSIN